MPIWLYIAEIWQPLFSSLPVSDKSRHKWENDYLSSNQVEAIQAPTTGKKEIIVWQRIIKILPLSLARFLFYY